MNCSKIYKTLLLAVAVSGMVCCKQQSASGNQLGKEICTCLQKADELPYESEAQKAARAECNKKQGEYWMKVSGGKITAHAFNKALADCVIQPKQIK